MADLVEAKPDNSRESTASKSERERGDSLRREGRPPSRGKGSGRKESLERGKGSLEGGKGSEGKEAMADVLNGFLNRLNSMSGSSIGCKDIQQLKSHLNRQESSCAELDRILLANLDSFEEFSSNPLQQSQKLTKILSTPSHPRLTLLKPMPKLQTRRIERTVTDSRGREFRVVVERTR